MPNIKSSSKRDALAKARNEKNRATKTRLRTELKKFDMAVAEGNREAAESAYKVAVSSIDHAAVKHLIHKNTAANKKSKITCKLNAMSK